MPDFQRLLSLPDLLKRKSFFLLGPRATGKRFLVRTQLGSRALVIDLLRSDISFRLAADPGLLEGLIGDRRGPGAWVVIDEVQKLPDLLDEVHRLIESRGLRFLLTGSSARNLSAARPTSWPAGRGQRTSTL
jgi:predicted AAA+ superfamily ATPase